MIGTVDRFTVLVPLDELEEKILEPGEHFYFEKVSGISVGILTSKAVARLHVALHGAAIRVYEPDG